ncbi:MAG: hypothetical protein WC489_08395 [Patescibacteria group bacterium]|jgi:ABC-type dipeptide/oligopeptide/nickel transport system ATPase component
MQAAQIVQRAPQPDYYYPSQEPEQDRVFEFQVVECTHCGTIIPLDEVKFRCPACKVFLDGPIAIAHYEDGDFTFQLTGESYTYRFERSSCKISAWDVLNQGPVSLLNQNRNWLSIVCGATGTGKSYTAIRICEMICPKFQSDQIAFSIPDLLDLFESCKAGDFIIFDEGNEWNAREAQKKQNVVFSKILSMLRFTQINVMFTLPHMGMIDINGRRLAHNYLYAIPVNRNACPPWQKNMSGVYWYDIVSRRLPSSSQQDIPIVYRFPVIKGERVGKVWFRKASETLLEEYESRKSKVFTKKLTEARKVTKFIEDVSDMDKQIERVEKLKEKTLKAKKKTETVKGAKNELDAILNSAG